MLLASGVAARKIEADQRFDRDARPAVSGHHLRRCGAGAPTDTREYWADGGLGETMAVTDTRVEGGNMAARTLQLPRLVAGRDYADDLVSTLGLEPDAEVLVDGSALLSGTPSFAAELVQQILVEGKARSR